MHYLGRGGGEDLMYYLKVDAMHFLGLGVDTLPGCQGSWLSSGHCHGSA